MTKKANRSLRSLSDLRLTPQSLKVRQTPSIFLAWLPLAVMWAIMAIEQPVITAVIARMSHATLQLAAFGIAFSLALFIEGSIVQMLAAGTAIANNRENYKRLLTMMHIIGGMATMIHAILCIPAVFRSFAVMVLGIPEELIIPSRSTFSIMLPWTLAVGYRRLWQGVLIRYGRTRVIPVTMVVRILVIIITLWWSFAGQRIGGAAAGGLSLAVGVMASALTAWFYVRPVTKGMPSAQTHAGEDIMPWGALIMFYLPLAFTNFINFGIRPVVQIGMARGVLPLESLAIWPVFIGYIFLYKSFSLASQEVVIARLDSPDSRRRIIRFSSGLALALSGIYLTVLFTPLWRIWYSGISNLESHLTALSLPPTILAFPVIPLSAFVSLFRGALIRQRRTREVTYGVVVNASVLVGLLFTSSALFTYPAISITAFSYALACAAEFLFLASRRPLAVFREQHKQAIMP